MAQEKIDIRRLAKLARLRLKDSETEKFTADMEGIVKMVENLPEFEKTDLPLNPEEAMTLREDEIRPSTPRDEILKNAPKTEAGCVVVPKVVDE